jgi:hypothetical protein
MEFCLWFRTNKIMAAAILSFVWNVAWIGNRNRPRSSCRHLDNSSIWVDIAIFPIAVIAGQKLAPHIEKDGRSPSM